LHKIMLDHYELIAISCFWISLFHGNQRARLSDFPAPR
jgi:hypothetical protein